MKNQNSSPSLHMVWIKVRDENGVSHLEARWVSEPAEAAAPRHAA